MTEEIEPAAYRVVSEIESESDEFYESKHAADTHCMNLHPEKVEGLFAAEDIIQMIKDRIQKRASKGITDGLDEAVIDELYEIKSGFQRLEVED